ncbi:hypothetical protein UlMin_018876 [Ulmus minor]
MAKLALSSFIFSLLLLCFFSGTLQITPICLVNFLSFLQVMLIIVTAFMRGKWCVAKPTTSDEILQKNIELACTHVDCRRLVNAGGDCFKPATLLNIASVTMNLYYQASGKALTSCDFWGTGLLVVTDPSYETCKYEYHH